jgi:hypothetical protein
MGAAAAEHAGLALAWPQIVKESLWTVDGEQLPGNHAAAATTPA